jgi:CheY-like chemotaxis protein
MKFTPEGGEITLRADLSSDGQVQPFVQIDSALNRQYPGTGLGLALVKQIVDIHGGTVSLTSTVGVGSCFTLNLPLDPSAMVFDAPLDMTDLTDPVSSLSSAAALPPLILLAEDNKTNILTLTSYLEAKGYRLRVVNNGQDAVAVALAENPDLVLMDIQMPVMDGLTAIQKIRQTRPLATLPIIALTALAMEGDRERCFQAGANDYLSKPVKLRELLELIQSLLPVANA